MNTIEIQLCKEDRARLDRIIEGLDKINRDCSKCVKAASEAVHGVVETLTAKPDTKAEAAPESPTMPQNETKAQPQEVVNPVAENNTPEPTEPEEQPEAVAPKVTLEQIQQKVLQLATGNSGAKKAQVRDVISAYGAKVSDLKDQPEKWDEVWEKLTALEEEVQA